MGGSRQVPRRGWAQPQPKKKGCVASQVMASDATQRSWKIVSAVGGTCAGALHIDTLARRDAVTRVGLTVTTTDGFVDLGAHLRARDTRSAAVCGAASTLVFTVQSVSALTGHPACPTQLAFCHWRWGGGGAFAFGSHCDAFACRVARVSVGLVIAATHRIVLFGAHFRDGFTNPGLIGGPAVSIDGKVTVQSRRAAEPRDTTAHGALRSFFGGGRCRGRSDCRPLGSGRRRLTVVGGLCW